MDADLLDRLAGSPLGVIVLATVVLGLVGALKIVWDTLNKERTENTKLQWELHKIVLDMSGTLSAMSEAMHKDRHSRQTEKSGQKR